MSLGKLKDDKLAPLLLKKIRLEVRRGQSILQIGEKHNQITEELGAVNMLQKVSSLEEIPFKKKAYSYVIADLDSPALDDFDAFLERVAPLIIRPGLLIIVGTNLCRLSDKIRLFLGKTPKNFQRPNRAVPSGFLRDKLLEKGFFVKNRYWQYSDKFLIMADIPREF